MPRVIRLVVLARDVGSHDPDDRGVLSGDDPDVAGRRSIHVPRGVDRADLEGVGPCSEVGEVRGRGARREGRAVQRALEGGGRVVGGEGEGRSAVAGTGGEGDRGVRRGGVDRPPVLRGRRVDLPRRGDRAHLERVRPLV